ncbi:MAG TPA: anthranilate synthase component I [Chthoniobacteraceae bacterium]|nr:anthranilate synthase component I [Chthoniobacteraceae bacterium]
MNRVVALKPGPGEFRELAKKGNVIPVYTELIADCESPVGAFQKIDDGGHSFLLESAEKNDQVGRYSFVGNNPRAIFESTGKKISITENGKTREYEAEGDPLTELQQFMAQYRVVELPDLPRFTGGAVGYIAYDVVRFFEPTIPPPPKDELGVPEMVFMITDTVLIFDHRLRRLRVLSNAFVENGDTDRAYDAARKQIEKIVAKLDQTAHLPNLSVYSQAKPISPESNTTREEYLQTVRDTQEFIHAGDIFQIVPSQRFETSYSGDALNLYRSLRFVNPSPYMFCFKFGGKFALVGSSPEVHVRAMNGKVEIRPIAGTRRRGATEEEDETNAKELLADPKERAEHLMLVDLARNDVGRIADFGTVRVTDFMTIEKYSHVMHIVSNVIGALRKDKNAYDVMRATFPAGTVSGSPKVRAMQIINQFEKSKRCTYAGAVGYFGFDGNLDSCITLRSIVLKDGKAYVQAGGGVVADSTPEGEYQETVNKAMGMMRAIEHASQNL